MTDWIARLPDPALKHRLKIPVIGVRFKPRADTGLPSSPVPNPNDTTLFTGSDGRPLHLPRYRIVDQPPQQVFLARGTGGWSLTVDLERYRAPELDGPQARDTGVLPHSVAVLLRMSILSGGMVQGIRELPLSELTSTQTGVRAVLRGTDSNLLDQVHLAMTDQQYAPVLLVNRSARITVPPVRPGGRVVSSGSVAIGPSGAFDFDAGTTAGAGPDVRWALLPGPGPLPSQRRLVPQGVAEIAPLGVMGLDTVTVRDLVAAPFTRRPVPFPGGWLRPGVVFAVRTGGGNYGKAQVFEAGARLALRWVTYTPPEPATGPDVVSAGTGVLRGTWVFDFDRGIESSAGGDVWWEQMTDVDRALVPWQDGRIVLLGAVDFETVTPSQLTGLAYGSEPIPGHADSRNRLHPGTVFAVRTGSGNFAKALVLEYGYNLRLRWVTVAPGAAGTPAPGLATEYTDTVRPAPDPFVFPDDSPVFAGLGAAGPGLGLQRHDVPYGGRTHSYYRDLTEPWMFFFLPDELRLARRDEAPHVPAMTVQINAEQDTLESTTVALAFRTLPYTDPARIQHARAALAALVPATLPPGVDGPVLQPLQADARTAQLTLTLPKGDGSVTTAPRPDAVIDLRNGLTDAITMPLTDFRPVFGAMFSGSDLLRGTITLRLGAGAGDVEQVPLTLRLDRTAGADVLDVTAAAAADGDATTVTAVNAVESPVQVNALQVVLARGGGTVPGRVSATTPPVPARLEPGQKITFTVRPDGTLPGTGPVEVLVGAGDVKVVLDSQKVWQAVLSQFVRNRYRRPITLEVFGSVFAAPADRPRDAVIELNTDLRPAEPGTVQVTPADYGTEPVPPSAKVTRPVDALLPIIDWLLDKPTVGEYEYRLTAVRASGITTGAWTSGQSGILPIQKAPPPRPTTGGAVVCRYLVRKGDSYWAIAQRLLGDPQRSRELQELNPRLRNLHPGDVVAVPWPAGEFVYSVPSGGSFWKAAEAAYGQANDALLARVVTWNGGNPDRTLHVGDRVFCPR